MSCLHISAPSSCLITSEIVHTASSAFRDCSNRTKWATPMVFDSISGTGNVLGLILPQQFIKVQQADNFLRSFLDTDLLSSPVGWDPIQHHTIHKDVQTHLDTGWMRQWKSLSSIFSYVEWPCEKAFIQDYNNLNDVMHFYLVIPYCKMLMDHKSLFSREFGLHAYRFPLSPHSLEHFSLYICPSNPYQPKRQWLESREILCNPWIIHHTFLEFCPLGWLSAWTDC